MKPQIDTDICLYENKAGLFIISYLVFICVNLWFKILIK